MAVVIGKRAHEALSKCLTEEFCVAYAYLSMSCVFRDMGLRGCADWCLNRYEAVRQVGLKIMHHLEDRGAKFKLAAIPVLRQDWRAPLHIFEEAQRQEQKLYGLIATSYESALVDKDYVSQEFLLSFINNQGKVDSEISFLINRLKRMQSSDLGIFKFDDELESLKQSSV
ncbi:MAG: hypothetical protein E7015_02465 [Alphaproteobacteria bacterium]|nr:hypothetical protein [Alphaproteobacteria bacterium]